MARFLFRGGPEAVGHVLHTRALKSDRIDTARHHQIVTQNDAVPGFLGGPASHPRAPRPVEGEVLSRLTVVGGQVILGQQVGDHGRFGDLAELGLIF